MTPERLSETIDDIYAAASVPGRWPDLVERIRILFDGSKACIARIGPGLREDDSASTGADPYFVQLIVDGMSDVARSFSDRVSTVPVGTVYSDVELFGSETLRSSRFWNEWMAPQDMYGGLGCRLASSHSSFWLFDVQRGRRQRNFDEGERAMMRLLAPHLSRALSIHQQMNAAGALSAMADRLPFGVLIVDAQFRISYANALADTLLDEAGGPLRLRDGRVVAPGRSGGCEAFRALVASACRTGEPRPDVTPGLVMRGAGNGNGCSGLVVSVCSLGARRAGILAEEPLAVVALRPISGNDGGVALAESLRSAFRLTPKEARIASRLAAGRPLREAAEAEGIRFKTARSYLESIFAKTGVHRQAELIDLIRNTDPILAPFRDRTSPPG